MLRFPFRQLDVFSATPLKGNPLAVVLGAGALTKPEMQALAAWTNISETVFLLAPTTPQADYKVRIFTPKRELPFAGHPTLGACHAWLEAGGVPKGRTIVQECAAGLIRLQRQGDERLAFAAPLTVRRELPPQILAQIAAALRVSPRAILASSWLSDKPPAWAAVMLGSRAEVLALQPDFTAMAGLEIGVIGRSDVPGIDYEVRAFAPADGIPEDPVTGSLNAGLASWLIPAGLAPASYVAAQGTALGRDGRIYVEQAGPDIWIGGASVTTISGQLTM